jgi:hypothetical protein
LSKFWTGPHLMFLIFFQLNAKADNRYDGKNFLTGCGKFEDQCPKCVCFQMQKLRFLAGKVLLHHHLTSILAHYFLKWML